MVLKFLKKIWQKEELTFDPSLEEFQNIINYTFRDINKLKQALSHRSYVYEQNLTGIDSNERMEFLGDAILEIITSEYLYRNHPRQREGKLTKMKGLLVRKNVLSNQARLIHLDKYIIMGNSANEVCDSILADAYEALICALYLDGGFSVARKFVQSTLLDYSKEILKNEEHINYKSIFQEYIQAKYQIQPTYNVLQVEGPDHDREYTIEVTIMDEQKGVGTGKNKKEAEQEAARQALEKINYWDDE